MKQPRTRRLARRLLLAQLLVIVAGAATIAFVGYAVSGPLFRSHLQRAAGPVPEDVGVHLDEALSVAIGLSLAIAVVAAVATALAVSWFLSSRIAEPIEELSVAATYIASGDYAARAPAPSSNDELADVTHAFNDMATALEATESTRRQLLADLAHELRTPLSTMQGYIEGLEDGVVEATPATWSTLRDAAVRMDRLVDDVSLVSRAEENQLAVTLEPVPARELVETALTAAEQHFAEQGVRLQAEIEDAVGLVLADRDRFGQVLANVLNNALQHTPFGGTTTVRAKRVGSDVLISVKDTGTGILPEHLPHVFERFYRGDSARTHPSGSGVGLTIARSLIHAHGGRITASSDGIGTGTTFTIALPRIMTEDRQR